MTTQMRNNLPAQELLSTLQNADSVLLLGHIAPDGDALGSVLALGDYLISMGKKVRMAVDGVVPENLRFLPRVDEVHLSETLQPVENELAVAVDTADEGRLGCYKELYLNAGKKLVIDHHGTNPGFGDINWVDGKAPAAAVLIWRLLCAFEADITKDQALCLYTALSTDTGNFIYESVNSECFTMMAQLMEAGLKLSEYSRILFRQKREGFVRLLAETLPTLRVEDEGRIACLHTAHSGFVKIGVPDTETDGVVDYAIDLKGVCMAFYAHEKADGAIKFSLRSLPPYRVDALAVSFGGGGHAQAAGCTMHCGIEEAVGTMLNAMINSRKEQDEGK